MATRGYTIASEKCCKCCAFCTHFQPFDGLPVFRPSSYGRDYYEIKSDARGRCPEGHYSSVQAGHPRCGKYLSKV